MEYKFSLFLRLLSAVILGLFYEVFYLVIAPITFYLSYLLLKIFYNVKSVEGALIINGQIFNFVPACYAILAYFLLALLILFTKDISFWKGLKMFLIGSAIIFFVNLLRILAIVMIFLEKGINYFNAVHLITWKVVSTIFVFLLWIFLTKEFKVKTIPVYSDVKTLIKKMKD